MAEDTVQDIRERLARIETLLENMTENNDLKNSNLDEKIKVANHRIQDLEDNSKWLWRAIAGAFISSAVAFIIKFK